MLFCVFGVFGVSGFGFGFGVAFVDRAWRLFCVYLVFLYLCVGVCFFVVPSLCLWVFLCCWWFGVSDLLFWWVCRVVLLLFWFVWDFWFVVGFILVLFWWLLLVFILWLVVWLIDSICW